MAAAFVHEHLEAGDIGDQAEADPFLPLEDDDRQHAEQMLTEVHQQFIQAVREGRGDRLKESSELFTGLVWTGDESVPMGLADKIGSSSYVAREVIGAEDIVEFTEKPDFFQRLSDRIGVAMAKGMSQQLNSGFATVR